MWASRVLSEVNKEVQEEEESISSGQVVFLKEGCRLPCGRAARTHRIERERERGREGERVRKRV